MSDSFADLWNSSAPPKSMQPQRLGSMTTNTVRQMPQQDAFSRLSSAGSSAPNSRSITPSMTGLSSQHKSLSDRSTKPPPGGDAFSELLGSSLTGGSKNGARMTIAERAAQAEKQRKENIAKHQQALKVRASTAWDGLDTLATSGSPSPLKPSVVSNILDDDWLFSTPVSQPTPQLGSVQGASPPKEEGGWDLDGFSVPATSKARSGALWDADDVSSLPSSSTPEPKQIPHTATPPHSNSPGDFDFGNREDRLLDADTNDEDDILGILSKPVDSIPKPKFPPKRESQLNHTTPSPPLHHRPAFEAADAAPSRSTSPPPHIVGRIVEMGFSIQQARIALASTDTGLDVESALEVLLSNNATSSVSSPQPQFPEHRSRVPQPRHATRERLIPRPRDAPSPSNSQLEKDRERNLQEQADKLLAQASEIGFTMFNKASSFWKEGKERVQKAYVERAASTGTITPSGNIATVGGRPKWMQEAVVDDAWSGRDSETSFSDEVLPPKPKTAHQPKRAPNAQPKSQAADLFSDEPTAYVSPFRRAKPQNSVETPPSTTRPRAPSLVRVLQRQNVVSASPSSIARSAKDKVLGAEKFKLGQYGDAEAAYTSAIACLPESHLLLVPLYNNRALTRLKTGDYSGAREDATKVVEIIGVGYHPAREAKVELEEEGSSVDLGDGLVKAMKRRAEAWEGREKWEEAGKDWEAVASAEWAKGNLRGEAVRGAGRCRRMVRSTSQSAVQSKPKPQVKPPRPPARRGTTPPSRALSNLRTANDAAEAEDQQRHELKDVVDARLMAWKGGKESNIRALIGSLDTVLWPELGLQKVGMADLVTPGQVKIKYTKTIAKLHPDKLNANNTTLEQRMVANGVFGALNEAWNAFKQ